MGDNFNFDMLYLISIFYSIVITMTRMSFEQSKLIHKIIYKYFNKVALISGILYLFWPITIFWVILFAYGFLISFIFILFFMLNIRRLKFDYVEISAIALSLIYFVNLLKFLE